MLLVWSRSLCSLVVFRRAVILLEFSVVKLQCYQAERTRKAESVSSLLSQEEFWSFLPLGEAKEKTCCGGVLWFWEDFEGFWRLWSFWSSDGGGVDFCGHEDELCEAAV